MGPIFNFFLNKVAVGPMNSAWTVLLQCINSVAIVIIVSLKRVKRKKKKENAEIWNANARNMNTNTYLRVYDLSIGGDLACPIPLLSNSVILFAGFMVPLVWTISSLILLSSSTFAY